jgi:hypothetical protein
MGDLYAGLYPKKFDTSENLTVEDAINVKKTAKISR